MRLSIGMPSYNNFSEVWFTIQSLRMHHNLKDCEILVVDNFGDPALEKFIRNSGNNLRYEKYVENTGASCAKNKVFELAKGEMVVCMDSHVLLKPGALDDIPVTDDLIHGPLMYNDTINYTCEWLPIWRGHMWGIWGRNMTTLPDKPFEIWGMGAGVIVARQKSWLKYNEEFKGFGGEEGYIHEKYRKAGRKVWCYPSIVWSHLFDRPIPYPLKLIDRVMNYIIGFSELGLDLKPVIDHFGQVIVQEATKEIENRNIKISLPIQTKIENLKPINLIDNIQIKTEQKLISALCITYGRPELLEESIESFLKQNYENKELIILNDLPQQHLKFENPKVKVFNYKNRFATLGEKRNECVKLSKGEILVNWDDDDLSLPWRLSQIAKAFEQDIHYFKQDKAWCLYDNELKLPHSNMFYMMSAFSRKIYNEIGGYKSNNIETIDFINKVVSISKNKAKTVAFNNDEYSFIYSSRSNSYHLSTMIQPKPLDALEKVKQFIDKTKIKNFVDLQPHWKRNYLLMTKHLLSTNT